MFTIVLELLLFCFAHLQLQNVDQHLPMQCADSHLQEPASEKLSLQAVEGLQLQATTYCARTSLAEVDFEVQHAPVLQPQDSDIILGLQTEQSGGDA